MPVCCSESPSISWLTLLTFSLESKKKNWPEMEKHQTNVHCFVYFLIFVLDFSISWLLCDLKCNLIFECIYIVCWMYCPFFLSVPPECIYILCWMYFCQFVHNSFLHLLTSHHTWHSFCPPTITNYHIVININLCLLIFFIQNRKGKNKTKFVPYWNQENET